MTVSVFDLFSIGVGPSSSHTVGPMRAASAFADTLRREGLLPQIDDLNITVYGSLAATGEGHGTFTAIMVGLEGLQPDTVDTDQMEAVLDRQRRTGRVLLAGQRSVGLCEADLVRQPAEIGRASCRERVL